MLDVLRQTLAQNGAKVALLDLNYDAAKAAAEKIGDNALAVQANCLEKASLEAARDKVTERFGRVDLLINGAGGNNPRGTTDDEMYDADSAKSFFDLDDSGIKSCWSLTFSARCCRLRFLRPSCLKMRV